MNWYRGYEGKTLTGIGYKHGNAYWVLAENFPRQPKKFPPYGWKRFSAVRGKKNWLTGENFSQNPSGHFF
jgi:hypothetical protein